MKQLENNTLRRAKRKLFLSIILLLAGMIYIISPIDIIPDILGPIGWVDDIFALLSACIYSIYSYLRLKKALSASKETESHS